MKKPILALLTASLLLLSSCGGSTSSAGGTGAKKIVIKASTQHTEDYPSTMALAKFKEDIEAKTNGQITVEIYPNNQLGPEMDVMSQMQAGDVHVAYCSPTAATINPNMNVLDLPFLFADYDHVERVVTSDIFDKIFDPFIEHDLRAVGAYHNGLRVISTSNKKIESLSDLAGLKMRVPQAPISIAIFNALGCNATPIAFNELYAALQQNVVDGQENGYPAIDTNKYYEVQKYIAETYHMWSANILFISEKFYQSLSDEHREMVMEALQDSCTYQRELYVTSQDANKQHLIDNGMEITYPDMEEFRTATLSVYDDFYKEYPHLKSIVEEIEAMR